MANTSSTRARSLQHLQSSLDFQEVHRRLRSEHGPVAHPESEILGALAEVDRDIEEVDIDIEEVNKEIEDCESEIYRLQSRVIFLQNHGSFGGTQDLPPAVEINVILYLFSSPTPHALTVSSQYLEVHARNGFNAGPDESLKNVEQVAT
ncbi:hypothetical protein BT96DRAFT_1021750 [Gymnopus androsaceus JB14]|uniref:Uncharacterized protein n=1 Tax=Gymnopus androsaceus JB14 TaxID=1447944 RepID=A0A6A4HDI4_9AGAR|nr:hypothetical protein BT96DRAFT_1021750 [Gymnopus androsaceus JB14]